MVRRALLTKKARTDEKRIKRDTAEELAKSEKRVCFEMEDKTEAKACMDEAATLMEKEFDDNGIYDADDSSARKENKRKQAERSADREVLGEIYFTCIKEAEDATAKTACEEELKAKKEYVDIVDDEDAIKKKYRAKQLADPSASCDIADAKKCRAGAKKEVLEGGLEKREFASIKRLGEIKSAAETWALCKDAENDDATCHEQAGETYEMVSGAPESDYNDEVKEKVERLGAVILSGNETVLRKTKDLDFEIRVNGSCITDDAKTGNMTAKVLDAATAVDGKLGPAQYKGCRKVDGGAEYRSKVGGKNCTDAEREAAPPQIVSSIETDDEISALLVIADARRLSESGAVDEVYGAEAVEECGVDDAECGQSDVESASVSSDGDGGSGGGSDATSVSEACPAEALSKPLVALAAITFVLWPK